MFNCSFRTCGAGKYDGRVLQKKPRRSGVLVLIGHERSAVAAIAFPRPALATLGAARAAAATIGIGAARDAAPGRVAGL
jgi:hypothetical protein